MKINYFVVVFLAISGCAQQPMIPRTLELPKKVQDYSTFQSPAVGESTLSTQVDATPKPPPATKTQTIKTPPPPTPATVEEANITLAFEQIPLPSFIQIVYSSILKRNVNVDPAIMARQDLVTIRTGAPQTASQAAETTKLLLKSYGIAVMDLGGIVRIVPDNANLGYLPEIRRGRALPETPLPLRPIFQLVELQAVRNSDINNWIKIMFGTKVTLHEDPMRNAVWLVGQSEDVTAALEAIHVLDQPLMKGRHSTRITPTFLAVDELSRKLTEVLQAEGYGAGPAGTLNPISLVTIPAVNAVIVFAADQTIIEHVVTWAKDLDKPGAKDAGRQFFSYPVEYSDAQALATTLDKFISGTPPPAPKPGTVANLYTPVRIVVDQASNMLIFHGGNQEDAARIKSLLKLLDRPAREALIEVTVAEVALNDNSQLGIEWLIKEARLDGTKIVSGTLGGLSIGSAGFNYKRIDSAGDTRLILNALASSNRATILSSPRVLARSGETATIQVGQEVPIITSQQTIPTNVSTGSVIQTVQYRSTGVILKVRPVIRSTTQVDLDVYQEVSSAQLTSTGVNVSPTFGTRKIDTKLSLKDGSMVMLGGLISDNTTKGDAGIPLLKDIPGVGQLFRNNTDKSDRTELIILITPYIISNDNDAQAVTDAFRKQLGPWAGTKQLLNKQDKPGDEDAGKALEPAGKVGTMGMLDEPDDSGKGANQAAGKLKVPAPDSSMQPREGLLKPRRQEGGSAGSGQKPSIMGSASAIADVAVKTEANDGAAPKTPAMPPALKSAGEGNPARLAPAQRMAGETANTGEQGRQFK